MYVVVLLLSLLYVILSSLRVSDTDDLLSGSDKTVRIWSNRNHQESTKLYMKYEVLHVDWMDDDVGVVVFDSAGIVSQWSRKVSAISIPSSLLDLTPTPTGTERLGLAQVDRCF